MKEPVAKDCDGKDIFIGDTIEVIAVPDFVEKLTKDIIGRKYKVVEGARSVRLINKKYKEKWRDEIASQWYLGKRCKKL